jgi:hypothetical protein
MISISFSSQNRRFGTLSIAPFKGISIMSAKMSAALRFNIYFLAAFCINFNAASLSAIAFPIGFNSLSRAFSIASCLACSIVISPFTDELEERDKFANVEGIHITSCEGRLLFLLLKRDMSYYW